MNKLFKAAKWGIGLCLFLAVIYLLLTWNVSTDKELPAYSNLLLETYKTLLTFSLITTGGVVLKALIDQVIENDRNNQIERNRHEDTRKVILKEFSTIFSEFYSIRKHYHSARSHDSIYENQSNDFKILIRQLLQKSVDLEGRFGSLKILIITHFDLLRGDYQTKEIEELKKLISTETDEKKIARHRLDLLGESYDDWRHAFEQNRKIKVDDEFWKGYDLLLHFLEKKTRSSLMRGTKTE